MFGEFLSRGYAYLKSICDGHETAYAEDILRYLLRKKLRSFSAAMFVVQNRDAVL